VQLQTERHEFFAGPLPAPRDLQAYDDVQPGLANRIVAMAEKQVAMAERQTDHRISVESHVIHTRMRLEVWGQRGAFAISALILVAAVYLICTDRPISGFITLGTTLASLVWANRQGKNRQDKELQAKRDPSGTPTG
jgi:uncharacterized membrane protein